MWFVKQCLRIIFNVLQRQQNSYGRRGNNMVKPPKRNKHGQESEWQLSSNKQYNQKI